MTLVSEDDHVVPEEMMTAVRSAELKDPRTDDTKVYKDECTYCFKTPFFNDGLFVSMASFHGFCSQHASDYALRTGHSLFLQIESKKVSHDAQPETSRPETGEPNNKISKLTIQDTPKFDIEDSHNLVVYPDFSQKIRISESLGEVLLGACRHVINTTSAERLAMLATSSNAWDAEIKLITKHSNLQQLNNGKTIPFSGWQCEAEGCGIRENLWLNLTDGAIRCGRSQFVSEGKMSEGNGHMQEYYSATGFPLVVKLGTICGQLEAADVYSYDEGDAVIDPNLDKHVAHFGLDATKLQKTEKSTMEMELDMNEKWEWAKCQEDGAALQSIYGPGYTGIVNIGSSCYINSVQFVILYVVMSSLFHHEFELFDEEKPDRYLNLSFGASECGDEAVIRSGPLFEPEFSEEEEDKENFRNPLKSLNDSLMSNLEKMPNFSFYTNTVAIDSYTEKDDVKFLACSTPLNLMDRYSIRGSNPISLFEREEFARIDENSRTGSTRSTQDSQSTNLSDQYEEQIRMQKMLKESLDQIQKLKERHNLNSQSVDRRRISKNVRRDETHIDCSLRQAYSPRYQHIENLYVSNPMSDSKSKRPKTIRRINNSLPGSSLRQPYVTDFPRFNQIEPKFEPDALPEIEPDHHFVDSKPIPTHTKRKRVRSIPRTVRDDTELTVRIDMTAEEKHRLLLTCAVLIAVFVLSIAFSPSSFNLRHFVLNVHIVYFALLLLFSVLKSDFLFHLFSMLSTAGLFYITFMMKDDADGDGNTSDPDAVVNKKFANLFETVFAYFSLITAKYATFTL